MNQTDMRRLLRSRSRAARIRVRLRPASAGEMMIALIEPPLGLPARRDDRGGLAALADLERVGEYGNAAVVPGSLDEDVAAVSVAGLGDPAFALGGAG